ncbi:hypothetical protein Tco_1433057 [Tanacetum coccineum]
MERAETREMSKPGLVHRLLRNRGKIGAAGSLTITRKVSRFTSQDYLENKVLGVSVLSFKGDKVLQEVSTLRFWFNKGFSVRVLLSSRILSNSLLLGFQVSETGLLDFYQSSGSRVLWLTRIDQEEVFVARFSGRNRRVLICLGTRFENNKLHNVERAETRETSEPSLVRRLLRSRRRIDVITRKVSRFTSQDYLGNKVLEVLVLSLKGDKVLQEVSTSRFWFKEGFSVRVLLSSRILLTSLILSLVGVVLDLWFRSRNRFVRFLGVQVRERQGCSKWVSTGKDEGFAETTRISCNIGRVTCNHDSGIR